MSPRWDDKKKIWIPGCEKDLEGAYGPIGSFIRQGPWACFLRIIEPERYEQKVLEHQASEGDSRVEAQGNIDAFSSNSDAWFAQRRAERNGAPKYKYAEARWLATLNMKKIFSAIIVVYIGRAIFAFVSTRGEIAVDNANAIDDAVRL